MDLLRRQSPDSPQDISDNVHQWLKSNEEDADTIKTWFMKRQLSSLFDDLGTGTYRTETLDTELQGNKVREDTEDAILDRESTGATSSHEYEEIDLESFVEDTDTMIPPLAYSSNANPGQHATLTSGSVTQVESEVGLRYLDEADILDEAEDTTSGLPAPESRTITFDTMQSPHAPSLIIDEMRRLGKESSATLTEEEYQKFRKQPLEVQQRSLRQ